MNASGHTAEELRHISKEIRKDIIRNLAEAGSGPAKPDCFGESGQPDELMEKYGMKAMNIVAAAEKLLKDKRQAVYFNVKTTLFV